MEEENKVVDASAEATPQPTAPVEETPVVPETVEQPLSDDSQPGEASGATSTPGPEGTVPDAPTPSEEVPPNSVPVEDVPTDSPEGETLGAEVPPLVEATGQEVDEVVVGGQVVPDPTKIGVTSLNQP